MSIKVKDLITDLLKMNPEAEIDISVDVSIDEATSDRRVFVTEYLGWQEEDYREHSDSMLNTLLFSGYNNWDVL